MTIYIILDTEDPGYPCLAGAFCNSELAGQRMKEYSVKENVPIACLEIVGVELNEEASPSPRSIIHVSNTTKSGESEVSAVTARELEKFLDSETRPAINVYLSDIGSEPWLLCKI